MASGGSETVLNQILEQLAILNKKADEHSTKIDQATSSINKLTDQVAQHTQAIGSLQEAALENRKLAEEAKQKAEEANLKAEAIKVEVKPLHKQISEQQAYLSMTELRNRERQIQRLLDYLEIQVPGKFQEELLNRCSSSRICSSGHYSFTAGDGKFFQMKKHCCKTELCNNATLSLPDRNMLAENGLQCPSCFSKGTIMCKSEKTINCLENETQCIQSKVALLTGVFQPHSFTFQGCGTTDFCAIGKNQRKIIGAARFVLSFTPESCYNASRISHQPEHEE
ncbi:uncharacterized protein LOC144328548 [Podarcis muralis]